MKLDDRAAGLHGIILFRTSEPERLRALAAAVYTRNRRLAGDLLIAARDLESRRAPRIRVIELSPQRVAEREPNHAHAS